MDTLRVNICYRPLRIGWAIRANDFDNFRRAVRYSYAFWGGRFNPILIVDHEEEAKQLIDLFRVDVIIPLGEDSTVKEFPEKYSYIVNPFFSDAIFSKGDETWPPSTQVLDIHNTLVHLYNKPEWKAIKDKEVHFFTYSQDRSPCRCIIGPIGWISKPR